MATKRRPIPGVTAIDAAQLNRNAIAHRMTLYVDGEYVQVHTYIVSSGVGASKTAKRAREKALAMVLGAFQ